MFDYIYATMHECRTIIGKRLLTTKSDRELWRSVTTWPDYLDRHIAAERGRLVPVSVTTKPAPYQRNAAYFALAEAFAEHGILMSTENDDMQAMQSGALPMLVLTLGPDTDTDIVVAWTKTLRNSGSGSGSGLRAGSAVDPNSVYPWASILSAHTVADKQSRSSRRARLLSWLELRDQTLLLSRDMRRQLASAVTIYVGLETFDALSSVLVSGRFDTTIMRQRLLDRVAEVVEQHDYRGLVCDLQQYDPSDPIVISASPSEADTDVMTEIEVPPVD